MNALLLIAPILGSTALFLLQTEANLLNFLIGICICLVVQSFIMTLYCLMVAQKAYRDAGRIRLIHNDNVDPQKDYPFSEQKLPTNLFLNKYTDQAKVSKKKNALKFVSLQQYYIEQATINQQPRIQTMRFLQQIKGYYTILKLFNNTLIDFGKSLQNLPKSFVWQRFHFCVIEKNYPSHIQKQDIYEIQRQILEQCSKTFTSKSNANNQNDIFQQLPRWDTFLKCLQFMGKQFRKIEEIRNSNSEMLQMIHKRLLEEYQFIEKQIISLGKSIEEIRNNIENLKRQKQHHQADQSTNLATQNDMVYWLKKQYYDFIDLELRIKTNERQFQEQTQRLKYYKKQQESFLNQNKQKYLKILKTRFFAFLDAYFISVDESKIEMKKMLQIKRKQKHIKPPRVHKIQESQFINESIQAQKKYFNQYSQRIEFYVQKLKDLWQGLNSLGLFLSELKIVFSNLQISLTQCSLYQDKTLQYFKKLNHTLKIQATRILQQTKHLFEVNAYVKKQNTNQINTINLNINNNLKKINDLLAQLKLNQGPIQYKYKIIKSQLEECYKVLQKQVSNITTFEQQYIRHTNRIKKIILVSMMTFLNLQQKLLNFGRIQDKTLSQVDMAQKEENFQEIKDFETNNEGLQLEENLGLETGYYFNPLYIGLVNRFLFAAFSQWKESNFFKATLCEELYIMFNLQPNQDIGEIQIRDLKFSGSPPEVIWIKQLRSEGNQFIADLNIAFNGKLSLAIHTVLFFGRQWDVKVLFQVSEFHCVMRVCFTNSQNGLGWFSFIGQPIAEFDIAPQINKVNISFQYLKKVLSGIILKKMKQATYPIRQKLPIPLSFKNNDLQIIKKRLSAQKN